MKLYRSYMFRTKDPVIDQMRTNIQRAFGSVKPKSLRQIEQAGGPSVACMEGWFGGATRRPQNATVEAAGRAIGLKRVWVRDKKGGK